MAGKKSYTTIAAGFKILRTLEMIALSDKPVDGKTLSEQTGEKYGTVMSYIATLEQAGYIERGGDGWICSQKLGVFWAKRMTALKNGLNKSISYIEELKTGL